MITLTEDHIHASYEAADDVSQDIITRLGEREVQVGYAVLGLALSIGRLVHIDSPLSVEQEIKFVEDLTEWSGAYWGVGKDVRAS